MSIHGILGEQTNQYPTSYSPEILFPIARSVGRGAIAQSSPDVNLDSLSCGVDWWHAFEVSWLNALGVAQVAMARFTMSATSPFIIESKSLKLYLNSLNFTKFDRWDDVKDLISKDLSECLQSEVKVDLFRLEDATSRLLVVQPDGICIDEALKNIKKPLELSAHPNSDLLSVSEIKVSENASQTYSFYSNLLRSNCPVTNQPDWGTLGVTMTAKRLVSDTQMLRYILSYQQHNGFHEQCVEQIFADLTTHFAPSSLVVRAWYTRRGGIDINPCRVSDLSLLPKPSRLIRQ